MDGYFSGSDGVRLYYRSVGTDAPTLVYLHGGPANLSDGGYAIDRLARGRTLIAYQQRSGGRSELVWDAERLRFAHYVADLEALRAHFGLEQMALAGNSFGAMVAASYAAAHPDRVTRLMLWAPGPPSSGFRLARWRATKKFFTKPEWERLAEIHSALPNAPDADVAALCREQIALSFRFYVSDPRSLDGLDFCSGSPESLRHEQRAMQLALPEEYDLLPDLVRVRAPTLVLEGAETRVPLDATEAWARAISGARLLLIPRANHLLYLEGGDAFFEAVEKFLDGAWPDGAVPVGD